MVRIWKNEIYAPINEKLVRNHKNLLEFSPAVGYFVKLQNLYFANYVAIKKSFYSSCRMTLKDSGRCQDGVQTPAISIRHNCRYNCSNIYASFTTHSTNVVTFIPISIIYKTCSYQCRIIMYTRYTCSQTCVVQLGYKRSTSGHYCKNISWESTPDRKFPN